MRTCKRCGRTLGDDEIVCRACSGSGKSQDSGSNLYGISVNQCSFCGANLRTEWEKNHRMCVDCHNRLDPEDGTYRDRRDNSPPRDHQNQTKLLGCLPIVLTITGICIFVSLFVQPALIIDYGTDTVSIPISWQGSVQTPVPNQTSAPKSKPKEKILGENMEFAFGTSSSVIDKKLDSYNYSHHLSDDQIIMTSSKNDILFGLIGLDIGRCVTITNWGFGDYDELTYYGYTLSNIEYSCLKKISNSEILEDDELSLILFSLNVIDKSATYNDLKDIFIKKYGECTDEDVNEDRGTGRAVWELDDNTVVILENDSYNVMVQHHTADSYQRETALREIRDAEALEKENSIRENRQ